ncbi:MAG: hypothetical protein AAFX40_06800 [Cyanobacteria bacterium J06639_1]
MNVSLEYLYHFCCDSCQGWWSHADIEPKPGDRYFCPHCGHCNTVDRVRTFRNSARGGCLRALPDPEPPQSMP